MIVVTGASGKLGRLVVKQLLKRAPEQPIVAAARHLENVADLTALGAEARVLDYERPETIATAFRGATRVLLVSSNALGQRVRQHRAVVDAAVSAGVSFIAYTSVLRAPTSVLGLAAEHKATEEYIAASKIPYALLRNGWYTENYTENLAVPLANGAFLGCAGNGRIAHASRVDYAEAAAIVLAEGRQGAATYELAGDERLTMSELANVVGEWAKKPIGYVNVSPEKHREVLLGAGLPQAFADLLVDSDQGIERGELDDTTGELHALLRRPTLSLRQVLETTVS
jgi:NAD(P)H dehydrogenase (quinone)